MKKIRLKSTKSLLIAVIISGLCACSEDERGYSGDVDLSLLCLKQAQMVWTGSAAKYFNMKVQPTANADTIINLNQLLIKTDTKRRCYTNLM